MLFILNTLYSYTANIMSLMRNACILLCVVVILSIIHSWRNNNNYTQQIACTLLIRMELVVMSKCIAADNVP